jgi:hypothetical protein
MISEVTFSGTGGRGGADGLLSIKEPSDNDPTWAIRGVAASIETAARTFTILDIGISV